MKKIFFQAEDGIRDLVRSRGLGDVYKRQMQETNDLDSVLDGGLEPFIHELLRLSLIHI